MRKPAAFWGRFTPTMELGGSEEEHLIDEGQEVNE